MNIRVKQKQLSSSKGTFREFSIKQQERLLMVLSVFNEIPIRQLNQQIITQDKENKKTIDEMHKIESFLNDLGFLSFGRDYVICGNQVFSLQIISNATELTMGSIISCCESGCIADAYTLLRKYRDDMFFYLYIIVYDACNQSNHKSSSYDKMKTNIEKWINNNLKDLNTCIILKDIGRYIRVREAVQKYNLKSYFDKLGDKMNNYVHSNGVAFYNRNANEYQVQNIQKQLKSLLIDIRFITITFLFLLTLCSPQSIMSSDYIDDLDCNITPPDESKYWVAPFITDFFKNNIGLLDESCIKYLQDNTFMKFE